MKQCLIIQILALLISFGLLSACDMAIYPSPTQAGSATASYFLSKIAATATPSAFLETLTTPTVTPEPRFTSTIVPTLTLYPTLLADKAEARLLDLLSDNGGCHLPCWWNITPGQTSMQEAASSLNAFRAIAPDNFLFDNQEGSAGLRINRDEREVTISIVASGDIPRGIVKWLTVYMHVYRRLDEETRIPIYENPLYDSQAYPYLPHLLSIYGPPSEAKIAIDVDFKQYFLILYYPENGWEVMFEMPMERTGDLMIGCPSKAFITLWLWSPAYPETQTELGLTPGPFFEPIDKATSLTLDQFYEQFKDASNTGCLESPADIYGK